LVSWLAASASSKCITPLKYVTKFTARAKVAMFSKPNRTTKQHAWKLYILTKAEDVRCNGLN